MKCLKCHHKNRDEAKFCAECGAKLALLCQQCGKTNPPWSKFCDQCGHQIGKATTPVYNNLSLDEKLRKLQRYLPKGLTDKILSKRDKIEGERKLVTVMFCDMAGFTPLVIKVGSEKAYQIMDAVYEILIRKVRDYDGTVNEMTGDGIMALFGAPVALEDAPQRAIRSALAIHREMTRLNDKLQEENEEVLQLNMRIGIHTGQVVVGSLGNDLRVEFKAVGETVNLASRMERLAEPGTTYITEATFKLTQGFFRFESLGEKVVKGKIEPVRAFRVLAPNTLRTRFDVCAEHGLTPFVARERERELLLDGYDRVKAGKGRAFSIVAEAGMGKSRLLYEFRKSVANENITFLEGKCLSYNRGMAYQPIKDMVRSALNIREGDQDREVNNKIINGLKRLGSDEEDMLPYLLELLSVKDSGIDQLFLSPKAQKAKILESIQRIVIQTAHIRPLIIAFEDLHWVDKSSEQVLKRLLDSIPGRKILLILTYRPEYAHGWINRSYHTQLTLNRLSDRENRLMVSYLLGTKALQRTLEELILEKAEGVPFFIEEFIKSFEDLKLIDRKREECGLKKDLQHVVVPSTLQDVIMARVDRLSQGAKEVLRMGSVIEREFGFDVLRMGMGNTEQELLSHLTELKQVELIYERGIYPERTYIFKHALTRDVIYDSILLDHRIKLHETIGDAIEAVFKENLVEHYGILAEHYIAGGNFVKGAEYSKLAAERSERAGAISDAIAFTEKRIEALHKMRSSHGDQRAMIDARTDLGGYLLQILKYRAAKEAIDPIVDLAEQSNYKNKLPKILTILGSYQMNINENPAKAFEYLESAVNYSRELHDHRSMSLSIWRLGITRALNCEFEKAARHFESALAIMSALKNPWGISAINSYLSIWGHGFSGKLDLVNQTSDEAVRIAEAYNDIYAKSMAYTSRGLFLYNKGELIEAEELLLKALEFCEQTDYVIFNAMARIFLAELYFDIGDFKNSEIHHSMAFSILQAHGIYESWLNYHKLGAAKAKAFKQEGGFNYNELQNYVAKNKVKLFEGWNQRYFGEILLHSGKAYFSEAEDWIQKAKETDKNNAMNWYLAKDYKLLAGIAKYKGETSQAKQYLAKAMTTFETCGADGWVVKITQELASCPENEPL